MVLYKLKGQILVFMQEGLGLNRGGRKDMN
jgi:hypothetical protein